MNKTIEEIRNETDANIYIDRAIAMLKEKCEGEYLVAGYNGIVSLLQYAKESHQFQQEQKQGAVWVRASERLPDADVKKYLRIEDKLAIGKWYGKDEPNYFSIHYFGEKEACDIPINEVAWQTSAPAHSGDELWDDLFQKHINFCNQVFPSSSEISCLHHSIEEICEIWKENDDTRKTEEYVDAIMCLLHGLNRAGISIKDFKTAFENKLNKNKSRTWNKNADGSYSHNKEIK